MKKMLNKKRNEYRPEKGSEENKQTIQVCYHYTVGTTPLPGIMPPVLLTLKKISEDKCKCIVCQKVFSISLIDKMNNTIAKGYIKGAVIHSIIGDLGNFIVTVNQARLLRKEIRPVKYYKDKTGKICYIDG